MVALEYILKRVFGLDYRKGISSILEGSGKSKKAKVMSDGGGYEGEAEEQTSSEGRAVIY